MCRRSERTSADTDASAAQPAVSSRRLTRPHASANSTDMPLVGGIDVAWLKKQKWETTQKPEKLEVQTKRNNTAAIER